MTDDRSKLPEPDGQTARLADGFDTVIWQGRTPAAAGTGVYLADTVRRLLAEKDRIADMLAVERDAWEARARREAQRAAAVAAELEQMPAPHDECPLWPGEDER